MKHIKKLFIILLPVTRYSLLITVLFVTRYSLPVTYLYCEQEVNITSDKVQFDKLQGKTIFSGNVKLKTTDTYLNCDSVEAYQKTQELLLKRIYFTTCDLENPHYKYYARSASLIVNKRITATNVVLFLGDIPSAILPYYYKNLKQRKYKIEIKPGYNNRDGFFAKGRLGYPLSEYIYGKLYLDYFTINGIGTGGEIFYKDEGKVNGTIYGYRINRNS